MAWSVDRLGRSLQDLVDTEDDQAQLFRFELKQNLRGNGNKYAAASTRHFLSQAAWPAEQRSD
jgi:hypothetical protein